MFICPKCQKTMNLPACSCGYTVPFKDGIWQLTDMPDMVKDGDGDKYIGYENIGETYSGNRKYVIEERDELVSKEISALTGNGVFFDLACGDGCLTVPCAQNGTRIIAGDISNGMLTILLDRARYLDVSLKNVTVCRMNALEIPLVDESVDTVVANSVLHLISNPKKVLCEIYRVMKSDGAFVCLDDAPGRQDTEAQDNSRYFEIVNSLYGEYWHRLGIRGITPVKYSWKFDRDEACAKIFGKKEIKLIRHRGRYEIPISDGFLSRFLGRGFSDQTDVPKELHKAVTDELMMEFGKKYGEDFVSTPYKGEYSDIILTIYRK